MKIIYIIRGASGSGKTTLAHKILVKNPEGVCYEADQFFSSPNSDYKFDPQKLGFAHDACKRNVEKAMVDSMSPIIVSNTSTRLKEIDIYVKLAKKFDYEVTIYRTKGPWDPDTLLKRNIHKVPLDTIKKQIARYEPHEKEIEYEN